MLNVATMLKAGVTSASVFQYVTSNPFQIIVPYLNV